MAFKQAKPKGLKSHGRDAQLAPNKVKVAALGGGDVSLTP